MEAGICKKNRSAKAPPFLTLGGNPVLDFCNTLLVHSDHSEDRLLTARDAESFVKSIFSQKLSLTEKQFLVILHLRSCLREYFFSILEKRMNTENSKPLADFLASVKLVLGRNSKDKKFSELLVLEKEKKYLQPIISEFFEFNRTFDAERIRKCANKNCSHLFYDTSKNNARLWCTMKSCGNLHKARSFQARLKNIPL